MPSVALRQHKHANIFLAASDNDLDSVTSFLDSGVDVNALDANGYSTMHAASSYNHLDLMRFLVSRGGDPNLADHDGDTPLFVAETREMCALLTSLGADAAHRNAEDKTAVDAMIEEEEFPDAIAYLSAFTAPGETSRPSFGSLNLAYREGDPRETNDTAEEDNTNMMEGLPQETRERIWQVIAASTRDGVNRDDELRQILSDALIGRDILEPDVSTRQRTE